MIGLAFVRPDRESVTELTICAYLNYLAGQPSQLK
jgi:hypothetical protein